MRLRVKEPEADRAILTLLVSMVDDDTCLKMSRGCDRWVDAECSLCYSATKQNITEVTQLSSIQPEPRRLHISYDDLAAAWTAESTVPSR